MAGGFLDGMSSPSDVKALDIEDLPSLCGEIRRTLVAYGKAHGGHIGSNLGVIELTVALHRVFDSPRDAIIFDVSHQSYTHKMLTGRAKAFTDPALFGSVTGFTNPNESIHDRFVVGHTGTSISLACGLAKTRDMLGGFGGASGTGNVIAVIGDGALSSGVAIEGLNNAAEQGGNLIVVVNDNEMSIAENFGGMYGSFAKLRASHGESHDNPFKALGLEYRYLEQGNDVITLIEALRELRNIDHPVVLHIHTTKGLGMDAEDAAIGLEPGRVEANHWQDPLAAMSKPIGSRKHYGRLAMKTLEARFDQNPGIVVISPATARSNGITEAWRERAGAHYVDTGIAEQHAVAFAAGIAQAGGAPVLATSSTFFQRAYDQIQQELALNHVPATLLVFSTGMSASDNTHSGAFDIPIFANIPDLTCLAPTDEQTFLHMLEWSVGTREHGGVVIRVPGEAILAAERSASPYPLFAAAATQTVSSQGSPFDNGETADNQPPSSVESHPFNRYRVTHAGSQVAIVGLGNTYPLAEQAAQALMNPTEPAVNGQAAADVSNGQPLDQPRPIDATTIDPQQYSTLDTAALEALRTNHRLLVTLEDGQLEGGWGEKISAYYANSTETTPAGPSIRVLNFGARKEFTDRVPTSELKERYGLTVPAIAATVRQALREPLQEHRNRHESEGPTGRA